MIDRLFKVESKGRLECWSWILVMVLKLRRRKLLKLRVIDFVSWWSRIIIVGSCFKYEYIFILVYMDWVKLYCHWFFFVIEKWRVENYISESVLIDLIWIISIIIRVRGSMYLKQISNEIKIKYIDLTEWWAVDIAWKGVGVKDWWKFLLKFQVSLYVAIENLNPVRSGKLYFYPPCILATDWIFTSTFQRAQE